VNYERKEKGSFFMKHHVVKQFNVPQSNPNVAATYSNDTDDKCVNSDCTLLYVYAYLSADGRATSLYALSASQ